MTTDDPLIETIAVALHYGACDGTHEDCPFWVHHLERARAVYAAIAATGRLLPDGGTTEVQHRYRVAGITTIGLSTEQIHDGDEPFETLALGWLDGVLRERDAERDRADKASSREAKAVEYVRKMQDIMRSAEREPFDAVGIALAELARRMLALVPDSPPDMPASPASSPTTDEQAPEAS